MNYPYSGSMAGADTQLWLIEGLPGSGKTSAAERLNAMCAAQELNSRWWAEEAKLHPVLPATLRKRASAPDFPRLCILAFRDFLQAHSGILILEGSAFQSSIRFMFANARPEAEITDYVATWAEEIAAARPRLLLFEVQDPKAHYAEFVAARRGVEWMDKLIGYVEATPVAQQHGWCAFDGFLRFWGEYQRICLACAQTLPWPVKQMPAWSETGAFDETAGFHFFI